MSKRKNNDAQWERRVAIIVLVFNLFLFMKGISAGYTATYLSISNPNAVEYYMNLFRWIPFLYILPIICFILPLFIKNRKVIKILDIVGIALCSIITAVLVIV